MNIFLKINSLIDFILGSFLGIIFLIRKRRYKNEILLVKLFSSKFGHYYSNTEIFLKENYNSNKLIVFYLEKFSQNHNELSKEISKYGLYNHIILLDESNSINEILNVIDIGIFASKGNEGFPNVIAEKMLTRIPCIVADVGDSRRIIGKNGYLYKKRSWIDLNKKIDLAYNNFILNKSNWIAKKNFSRKRIVNFFSLKRMINKYNRVWIK